MKKWEYWIECYSIEDALFKDSRFPPQTGFGILNAPEFRAIIHNAGALGWELATLNVSDDAGGVVVIFKKEKE